jgi:hypothetical protein
LSVSPDIKQALQFFAALYPAGGIVHMRSVAEPKDGRAALNHHYQLDHKFPGVLADYLNFCATDRRAAFFLPGTVQAGATGKAGVLSLPSILADFDKGDAPANLAAAEALLGPATMTVESGGTTDANTPKLHAYWVLEEPAMKADIDTACAARLALAERFNGDRAFQQPAQIIRIPGSIHQKGTPKLVQLRSVTAARYSLPALSSLLGVTAAQPAPAAGSPDFFDFSRTAGAGVDTLTRALTAPVHSEGADGITRFEAAGSALGHFIRMVRQGKMTEPEAWQAALEWNQATLIPPWEPDRLRGDFDRLAALDLRTHGAIVAPALPAAPASGWALTDWRSDRFQGAPPVRQWIVDGVIPTATAGIFAAPGDAGKSMMALKLALDVATLPPNENGLAFPPRFFGGDVIARGAVVLITSEDDAEEVHRRLHALDPTNQRAGKPLYVVPMISAGGARSIVADGANGPCPTPFWVEMRAQLAAIPNLQLAIFDPLSSLVAGDTNDNTIGAAYMMIQSELAATTRAASLTLHHFAKGRGTPASLNEARDAIRGAGAFVDNARWALVMWEADEEDAYNTLKPLGQEKRTKAAGIVYRGGLAKSNAPGEKRIRTLVRNAETGLLEDVTEQLRKATPRHDEIDDRVFKALMARKLTHPKFTVPKSRKALEQHGVMDIVQAAVDLGGRQIELSIERLIKNGQLQRTEDAGVSPRFEPVS